MILLVNNYRTAYELHIHRQPKDYQAQNYRTVWNYRTAYAADSSQAQFRCLLLNNHHLQELKGEPFWKVCSSLRNPASLYLDDV